MEATTEFVLIEKIQRLERQVTHLQRELRRTERATFGAMLGPLRLRETVLLYIGTEDAAQFSERLAREFDTEVACQALQHLFDLNRAPVPDELREAMRAVFNHGMRRW
ncbi:MAG: hypothetical protein LBI48_09475 [Burkholderiaceae bacterium]|jgi:hypothetical protein|nr:hypothetical protein [Burkholderiaceae bacterium]